LNRFGHYILNNADVALSNGQTLFYSYRTRTNDAIVFVFIVLIASSVRLLKNDGNLDNKNAHIEK